MSNNNNISTIKFNVGGRHFEVSRALVDQHPDAMLGKLVSDAWQEDPEETVFIDRNGDTFAYVLDYLRYGSIDLPGKVPKSMFDRELDFYGINSVEGTVNQESLIQVIDSFHHAKTKHDMFFLAFEAHYQHGQKKESTSKYVRVDIGKDHKLYNNKCLSADEQKLFKRYLGTYFGLQVARQGHGYHAGGLTSYAKSPSAQGGFIVYREE
ncbi:hypothetical protein ACHAXR_004829 [Thalassiosira sp. AJA248-18]